MSNDKGKLFSDPRWNDTSKPTIIGSIEITEAEQLANKERLRAHLRKIGVLKNNKEQ
jgi:hypothetical protein